VRSTHRTTAFGRGECPYEAAPGYGTAHPPSQI